MKPVQKTFIMYYCKLKVLFSTFCSNLRLHVVLISYSKIYISVKCTSGSGGSKQPLVSFLPNIGFNDLKGLLSLQEKFTPKPVRSPENAVSLQQSIVQNLHLCFALKRMSLIMQKNSQPFGIQAQSPAVVVVKNTRPSH